MCNVAPHFIVITVIHSLTFHPKPGGQTLNLSYDQVRTEQLLVLPGDEVVVRLEGK